MSKLFCLPILLLLFASAAVFCSDDKKTHKVVIIGAGAAGIAAASKLLEHGINDIGILEAEDRYGGRIYNEYEGDYYKALGAEQITANDKETVYNIVKKANAINEHWIPKSGIYAKSNGEELSFESLTPYIELMDNSINELHQSHEPLIEFFKKKFSTLPENEFDVALAEHIPKFLNAGIRDCDWTKESGLSGTTYHGNSGDPKVPINGMKTILDILMGIYPSGVMNDKWKRILQLGNRVNKIYWNLSKPIVEYKNVHTSKQMSIEADHVIITIPLGVLKANHDDLFEPKLPAKNLNAINLLKVITGNNMFLTFNEKWWPENNLFAIWTKDDVQKLSPADKWMSKIQGFMPVDNSTVLAVNNNELSDSSSEVLSDEELSNKLMTFIRKAFGSKGWKITDPIKFEHSRWHTNPNCMGAFSYTGIEAYEAGVTHADLREPLKNSEGQKLVLFAGEATHDHQFSSVNGAIETGFDAAQEVIKMQ